MHKKYFRKIRILVHIKKGATKNLFYGLKNFNLQIKLTRVEDNNGFQRLSDPSIQKTYEGKGGSYNRGDEEAEEMQTITFTQRYDDD